MQKTTKVKLNQEAREAILKGVNAVYDPVRFTLGPEGGNALMYQTFGRGPRITNDGVTIAECIQPKNEFIKLSADTFKESCKRTNELAGDGTTTTAVIGGYLMNEIFAGLSQQSGIGKSTHGNVMEIKRKLLAEKETVIEEIKKAAKKIDTLEDLEKIATVSVENEELGKLIASIVWETGVDGHIDVVEGFKGKIEHEVVEGMRFPAKVPNKVFVNNPARHEMIAEDTPVLVTDYKIDNVQQTQAFVNKLLEEYKGRKLCILAPDFSNNVLVEFVGALKNQYYVYPVKVPSLRTPQFEDVAAYFGATFVSKEKGVKLETLTAADLGFVERFIVKDVEAREDAIARGGKGAKTEAVKERMEELKKQREETKAETHKKLLDRRIASMASAIGIVRVGAPSQAEGLYLKLKVEDAVYACKAALEEGYVKGGGLCLKEIAKKTTLLKNALEAPHNQIQENAEQKLKIPKEVVDPAKSMRLAVEHAISVTAHLITVKIMMPEINDQTPGDGYTNIAKAILAAKKKDEDKDFDFTENEGSWDRELEAILADDS